MRTITLPVPCTLLGLLRSRTLLHLEVLALRQQLAMLNQTPRKRLRFHWGQRLYWTWKSRCRRGGRPPIAPEVRELIRTMSRDNVGWGAPRIHGELQMLGIQEVLTAPRSPWQNPYVERIIGSIRRECLDQVIALPHVGGLHHECRRTASDTVATPLIPCAMAGSCSPTVAPIILMALHPAIYSSHSISVMPCPPTYLFF